MYPVDGGLRVLGGEEGREKESGEKGREGEKKRVDKTK